MPPGNPARITAIADLAKPGVKVVLCAPAVPCGAAAEPRWRRPPGSTSSRSARSSGHRRARQGGLRARPTPDWSTSPTSRAPATRSRASSSPSPSSAVNTYPIATLEDSSERRGRRGVPRRRHRRHRAGHPRVRRVRASRDQRPCARRRATAARAARLGVRPRRDRRGCSSSCRWWRCSPGSTGPASSGSITSESSRAALALSLRTSLASTVLCILFGVPMALVLARDRVPRPVGRCVRWSCCRSCCRPSWAASRCSTPSAAAGLLGHTSRSSGSRSPSPPPPS